MFKEVVHIAVKLNYQEAKDLLDEQNVGRPDSEKLRLPEKHELQTFSANKTADKSLWEGVVYWVDSGDEHEATGVILNTGVSKTFSRTSSVLSVVFVR